MLTIEMLPVANPALVGAKVTESVLFCPGASVRGSLRPLAVNPFPVMITREIVTLAVPVSNRTSGSVLCPPSTTLPKVMPAGLALSWATPVEEAPPIKTLNNRFKASASARGSAPDLLAPTAL